MTDLETLSSPVDFTAVPIIELTPVVLVIYAALPLLTTSVGYPTSLARPLFLFRSGVFLKDSSCSVISTFICSFDHYVHRPFCFVRISWCPSVHVLKRIRQDPNVIVRAHDDFVHYLTHHMLIPSHCIRML